MSESNITETSYKKPFDWQKALKPLGTIVAVIVILIAGWMGYQKYIVEPKEQKAENAIAVAQQYFAADSFRLALNGDGSNKGFPSIAKNFSGTKAGNMANYYSGVCYLQTGDFKNAIKYLKSFSTDAKQIQMMAEGALGDAYSENKQFGDAIDAYKKAATTFEDDDANSSEYLFRAAALSEVQGKTKDAVELYKQLKDKFPNSEKGSQADKYIYRLSIEPNDLSVK